MSVICHEDGEVLHSADQAFSATTETSPMFLALCNRHLELIPMEKRSLDQLDGGIDIHDLFGQPNRYHDSPDVDTLSLRTMDLGDRRFSISRAIAEIALPKCVATLDT